MLKSAILVFPFIVWRFNGCASQEDLNSGYELEFGNWYPYDYCPTGYFANAFEVETKEEERKRIIRDEEGMTGMRLYCSRENDPEEEIKITSYYLRDIGTWRGKRACRPGHWLIGFRLLADRYWGWAHDDTAANDADMICSDGTVIYGGGNLRGDWLPWSNCSSGSAICGLQTKVEDHFFVLDKVGLVTARLRCCAISRNQSELSNQGDVNVNHSVPEQDHGRNDKANENEMEDVNNSSSSVNDQQDSNFNGGKRNLTYDSENGFSEADKENSFQSNNNTLSSDPNLVNSHNDSPAVHKTTTISGFGLNNFTHYHEVPNSHAITYNASSNNFDDNNGTNVVMPSIFSNIDSPAMQATTPIGGFGLDNFTHYHDVPLSKAQFVTTISSTIKVNETNSGIGIGFKMFAFPNESVSPTIKSTPKENAEKEFTSLFHDDVQQQNHTLNSPDTLTISNVSMAIPNNKMLPPDYSSMFTVSSNNNVANETIPTFFSNTDSQRDHRVNDLEIPAERGFGIENLTHYHNVEIPTNFNESPTERRGPNNVAFTHPYLSLGPTDQQGITENVEADLASNLNFGTTIKANDQRHNTLYFHYSSNLESTVPYASAVPTNQPGIIQADPTSKLGLGNTVNATEQEHNILSMRNTSNPDRNHQVLHFPDIFPVSSAVPKSNDGEAAVTPATKDVNFRKNKYFIPYGFTQNDTKKGYKPGVSDVQESTIETTMQIPDSINPPGTAPSNNSIEPDGSKDLPSDNTTVTDDRTYVRAQWPWPPETPNTIVINITDKSVETSSNKGARAHVASGGHDYNLFNNILGRSLIESQKQTKVTSKNSESHASMFVMAGLAVITAMGGSIFLLVRYTKSRKRKWIKWKKKTKIEPWEKYVVKLKHVRPIAPVQPILTVQPA